MAYDERAWYVLTGPEGQQTTSFGDNNYVRQAMEEGIPISVTSKGEWFTRPYVEVTPTGYLTHIPSWFKGTDEYNQWKSIESQAASFSVNKDNFNNINNTLKALGNQGALRYTTYKQTDEVGITDPSLKQFVFDQYLSALNEGANKEAASIQAYGSTDSGQSVAEFAREFKNMSKEDLSKNLVKWEYIINDKNADPVDKANVYTAYRILNLVADNPTDYGDGKEFEGLLEASEWQKFQTHINNVTQTISENFPLVTFGARLGSGLASAMGGQSFADGWQIEKRRDQQYGYLRNETTGAGLRGTEGSAVSGTVAGSVVNMAGTMVEAVAFGTWFNSTALGSSVGAALKGGTSLSTLGGGMVFDFFFNDLPVDLSLFASDLASTGSTQEAWESQSGQTQPLFGVFGPEVPAGMKYNLIGDALMDLTLPVMGIANKAMWNTLDDITGGGVTKLREKVALKNLAVQQKISDMPVIGTGLQKFSNWLFSEENATHIREARKQAIAEGSMTPYIVMQNLLTLSNHYGAEVVAPMYRKLVNDLDINGQIKTFQKNAASYGGIGKVETKWDSYKSGVKKQVYEAIQDDIPRDVKKGLLDYQRLEELKGEREIEGAGLISNPKRDNEIVELEKRVENLAPEIKKFADDFSTLNKQVEQMGVTLGLSTQEWVDALMADPRWKNYMVRQVLLPGGVKATGALDPATNKLLTGKRTGYYNPDQTLSPIMALDMKVHAMGNAYAWNERAKAVVASEISQGKISVGTNGVDIAQKISEKRALIAQSESVKIKLGYDGIVNGFNERMEDLSGAVKKINDQINALDNITVKSVYTNGVAPETKGIVADYNAGKITYADGVIEKAGFSAQEANTVIQNTYKTGDSHAGVSSDGVPYRYIIEDNKITSMEKITDPEGLAESVSGMGIGFSLGEEEIKAIGVDNVAAINKAQLAYRDNNMAIPGTNTRVRVYEAPDGSSDGATLGFNYPSPEYHIENGKVVGTNEIYLNTNYYGEGRNTHRIETAKKEVKEGFFVRNTEGPEYTPIHENAHALTKQIAVEEFNEKISSGRISLDRVEALSHSDSNLTYTTVDGQKKYLTSLEEELYTETLRVEDEIISGAMKRVYPDIDSAFSTTFLEKEVARNSKYPLTLQGTPAYNSEIIAAAMEDYFANGSDANVLSVAIAAEVSDKLQKHQMAVSPKVTLQENSLQIPKGLLKGDEYAFPATVKTQAEKAEWLDKWRQKNPYIKGELDADTFQKANLWDSYFQKEIRAYNSGSTSSAPDALLEKSGRFVEQERARAAKEITAEIKRLSGGEFDSDLAMIIMGKNGEDIYKAMNNYIIRQVDISAEELAKNMEGGLTAENLNTARVTLWSDSNTKESVTNMLEGLVPDSGENVASMVDALFDKQSKGLAAYDALPVDAKALIEEKDKLVQQLYKENKAAIKDAEAMDKNSAFRDGGSHIIHYKEGGEDVYLSVSDPVIGSMFEKPYDFKEHGMVAETMTTVANFMATTYRLGTTGMNPMAFIRNVLRDPIQAFATAGTNPLGISLSPEAFYKSLRQYGLDNDTIATVSQRIRSWAQSGTMTEEMRLGPGRGPSTYRNNMEYVSNRLKDATNGKIVRTLQAPLETWEGFFRNQVGQQSFVKNYRRTGDVDKALASALFDTSNATTNFSHAIGKWKWATSTVPYLSSAINGTVSFWRLFNVDPVGMVTRITAGFMVPVMAITAWNLSNEDNRKAYETLPEWFKQGHLVMTDGNGNILAFPLPEEIQQFAGTARKLIEFTQEASPYSLATIAAQGAFGFLPFEVDGFWGDDGSLQLKEGAFQMVSGLIPQAATTLYELIWQQDLFTGEDLSTYNGLNTTINTLSNIFGTGIKQVVNSIGIMAGASEKDLVGKSLQDTIARDLFGMGFDAAKNQFMAIVGSPAKLQENGTMTKATGLFKENEELKKKIDALSSKIAVSSDAEKAGLEEQKQTLINEFTDRVKNAMDKYQRMFSLTGGLEMWQKNRLVQLLTLGDAWSSGEYTSYQAESASEAYLNERGLAQQRYVQAGLPAGPDLQNLVGTNSIEIQAALNSFYGAPKQAATDYRNAIDSAGVKKIRNEFYNAVSQIYDAADAQGRKPDYDLIEKIQARYLQSVDAVLVPIINQYGINILNNSDFIDAVRKQVNGMIPSDDWKQSTKNTKKYLSSKEFPTTTVDVKKWLIQRYSSGMKNRNIGSDQIVVDKLAEIKADLDAGRRGSAQSKINSLKNGIDKANYYISSQDFQTLTQYNNMLK